ncbi:hypothetical protein Syun_001371 [Stephania yunnanensis]|uniref:Uncharacterized protein n=1 Tax=Stephania yunnanensis TaxID=152371 RepID=A0AAP0LDZ1_9MAGN
MLIDRGKRVDVRRAAADWGRRRFAVLFEHFADSPISFGMTRLLLYYYVYIFTVHFGLYIGLSL